jgi:hypothetical protein
LIIHEQHRKYSTEGHTENARVMKAHTEMWVMTLNLYQLLYCTVVEPFDFIPNSWTYGQVCSCSHVEEHLETLFMTDI